MANYYLLNKQLTSLLANETNTIANLANASALVNQTVDRLNWVGFYLYDRRQKQLNLGPFQGQVACMHIKLGDGVCGQAAQKQQTMVVDDVSQFPGYISCDTAAQSELVIPIITPDGDLFGVFDLDAPVKNCFNSPLVDLLEETAQIISKSID